jgi:hypothetical protein
MRAALDRTQARIRLTMTAGSGSEARCGRRQ